MIAAVAHAPVAAPACIMSCGFCSSSFWRRWHSDSWWPAAKTPLASRRLEAGQSFGEERLSACRPEVARGTNLRPLLLAGP
jgi:hypothetical protein